MKTALIVLLVLSSLTFSQESKIRVSVAEVPPEPLLTGTCTQSTTGYLGIVQKDVSERTKLTDQEIGKYVNKSLAEGYSVTLYPQASGKVFTVAICHPAKP